MEVQTDVLPKKSTANAPFFNSKLQQGLQKTEKVVENLLRSYLYAILLATVALPIAILALLTDKDTDED